MVKLAMRRPRPIDINIFKQPLIGAHGRPRSNPIIYKTCLHISVLVKFLPFKIVPIGIIYHCTDILVVPFRNMGLFVKVFLPVALVVTDYGLAGVAASLLPSITESSIFLFGVRVQFKLCMQVCWPF